MEPSKEDVYHRDEPPSLARLAPSAPGGPDPSRPYRQAAEGAVPRAHGGQRTRVRSRRGEHRSRRGEHNSRATLFNKSRWLGLGGVVVLWIVSLAAALWPARRASMVSPATATRTV